MASQERCRDDVTARTKKPELSAEEAVAVELVRRAREQGLSLTARTAC